MAIGQVLAGHYTSTYNQVACNFTRNGYELEYSTKGDLVNESDAYGDSLLDIIHRGADISIMAVYRVQVATIGMPAAPTGNMLMFYPWGVTLGTMFTTAAPIGRRASDVAQSLVLTSTANTPAAATPATLTASKAILAPNSNLKLLLTSKARDIPVRLALLPSESGGTGTYFSMT